MGTFSAFLNDSRVLHGVPQCSLPQCVGNLFTPRPHQRGDGLEQESAVLLGSVSGMGPLGRGCQWNGGEGS